MVGEFLMNNHSELEQVMMMGMFLCVIWIFRYIRKQK